MTHGIGNILTFQNLCHNKFLAQTTLRAVTQVCVKRICIFHIRQLMDDNPSFKEQVFRQALTQLVQANPQSSGPLRILNELNLVQLSLSSQFLELERGEAFFMPFGGYLFQGSIYLPPRPQKINKQRYRYVMPNTSEYLVHKRAVLLRFESPINFTSQELKDDWDNNHPSTQ